MAILTADVGDVVEIYTSTVFQDRATATPFDPDVVKFTVTPYLLPAVTYTVGTDPEATKVTVGSYKLLLPITSSGRWRIVIKGSQNSGDFRGAASVFIDVEY